jgi:single-strand DNA-binding protein
MNQMTIMGRLGSDPEVRFTSSGQKVTTLRVATNQKRAKKEETVWWKVTVWGESFDKMMAYFKKGSAIIASGEMSKPEIYTDKEGRPQVSLNLTSYHLSFSPFGKSDKQESGEDSYSGKQGAEPSYGKKEEASSQNSMSHDDFTEDEIPF